MNMLSLTHMIYHTQREHVKVNTHDLPHLNHMIYYT